MSPPRWRRGAIVWCLVMTLGVVVAMMPSDAPLILTVVFAGVWLFGAAMLWQFPRFGGWGTALYGVILGVNILTAHGVTALTVPLAIGSFLGTGLAAAALWEMHKA